MRWAVVLGANASKSLIIKEFLGSGAKREPRCAQARKELRAIPGRGPEFAQRANGRDPKPQKRTSQRLADAQRPPCGGEGLGPRPAARLASALLYS